MASFAFRAGEDYAVKLSRLAEGSEEIAKKAVFEGAKIVTDQIRANLSGLPEEKFRMLKEGETFSGISADQKKDLLESLGVTPIVADDEGNINAKVGFDGYGSRPTKKYKQGVPNQLLARAIESGSSVRQKKPFVRPAVNATKKRAQEAMNQVIADEMKKKMEG